ncbi:hypothetical protein [Subtercola endophyticus]|uniref:hypothetical protein n=1 Tax=Subtercola endophyticus TaxID=2895559 RepID=UPI001E464508|nr:hypothetical protein [Subtercola endophyticus]UFS59065.1 hypothetical protein LQ955_19105 [Subtercola endophyticus]
MNIVDQAVEVLRMVGVTVEAGLSESELRRIESTFDFRFGPDHRQLLSRVLPVGKGWVGWRSDSDDEVRKRLDRHKDWVLSYVVEDGVWGRTWGERPTSLFEAADIAIRQINLWPALVPLYAHRYMPAEPSESGAPVLSVHGLDTIFYGTNLAKYFLTEFGLMDREAPTDYGEDRKPPWSQLELWFGDSDLW